MQHWFGDDLDANIVFLERRKRFLLAPGPSPDARRTDHKEKNAYRVRGPDVPIYGAFVRAR